MTKFRNWFIKKYDDWRGEAYGRERSVTEFAQYLGIAQPTVNSWLKGTREPKTRESINKIADRYGAEVFDVAGFPLEEHERFYWEMAPVLKVMTPEEREMLKAVGHMFISKEFGEELKERVRLYRLKK